MKDFSKLCTPAKIYFGIAVIATLFDLLNGVSFMFAFWKMLFAFIWTFILGGLCDKGYKSISWALVLLPYILMFLASLNIYHVTDEQRQFMRSIQLQGAYGQEAFTPSQAAYLAQQQQALAMGAQQQQAMAAQQAQAMAAQQAQAMAAQQAQAMAGQQAQAKAGQQAAYLAAQKAMLEDQAKAADKAELELLRSKLPQAQKDYDNSVGKHPSTRQKLFNTLKGINDKITQITNKYKGNI
jgi:hypothetical protein